MEDVHRILVALGLGKYSQGVYEFGARMAQAMQAELIVANIINTRDVEAVRTISSMGYEVDGQHFIASVKAEREAQIDAIVAKAALPGIQPRVVIRTGSPIEALMDLISEEKIDAIVMGPKGRTDLDNVLVGSVAEKLFRRSPVTVISYRDERHAERLKKAR
jgi:nucleotide-binding universal stress UspA family protein